MEFSEKKVDSEYIYKGRILNLRKDNVALPNGNKSVREIIEHGGGSAILCVKDDNILLVKQFRYAYGKAIWEIPAGKIEKGENPTSTAFRELEEECGIKAENMTLICKMYPSPGYTEEIVYIYRAENLNTGSTHFDIDENIESCWFDVKTAKDMVKNGEINDAKTIIAISMI